MKRIKVFVFDVDGTLLHRDMKKVDNIEHDYKINGRHIYLRPQLHHLAFHFNKLS